MFWEDDYILAILGCILLGNHTVFVKTLSYSAHLCQQACVLG